MSKELILQILNSEHRWELLDLVLLSSNEHFMAISEIFELSKKQSNIVQITSSYSNLFGNFSFTFMFWYTLQQMSTILKDNVYAMEEYQRYVRSLNPDISFDVWLSRMTSMVNRIFNYTNLGLISIPQILSIFKNYFYKNDLFDTLFVSRLTEYIYGEFLLNNLSPETMNFIYSFVN